MAYFDTSILVPYYCPERLSEKAERALQKADSRIISILTEVEFSSSLSRKIRELMVTSVDAARMLAEFRSHMADSVFSVHPVTAGHFSLAANWISSFTIPLRTLDALHLAVASEADEEIITADKIQAVCARQLRLRCTLIE